MGTWPNLVLVVVTLAKQISGKVSDKPVKDTKTGLKKLIRPMQTAKMAQLHSNKTVGKLRK